LDQGVTAVEKILFLAHTEDGSKLPKAALEALSAATILRDKIQGAVLRVGLFGEGADRAAGQIAACGAESFLAVSGADFKESRYVTDAAAIEGIVKASEATLILAPGTPRIARVLPGAAVRLGGKIDTRISALEVENGALRVLRWYYRQRMSAVLQRQDRPWFLTVDSGVYAPYAAASGQADCRQVRIAVPADEIKTRVEGIKAPSQDAQTIRPEAPLLFVAGAGWTKKQGGGSARVKEAEALILNLLKKAQASLGGTKSLVDQGAEGEEVLNFMSHMNQVGQTGSTPRHPKGLAACCYGEEPHVVGWRFINERRAVNTDPNCGWAQGKADVLYVADAFEVIEKLNALL